MTSRKSKINDGSLAEHLSCMALDCTSLPSVGYDIVSSLGLKGEVRSRTLGTDGKYPRLTLTQKKMDLSDFIVFIYFSETHKVQNATLIKTESLHGLYSKYEQSKRKQAHIPLRKIIALADVVDVTDIIDRVDS